MYTNSSVREHYKNVVEFLEKLSIDELNKREEFAKRLFMSQGVTFTVYSSGEGIEKIFPFEIIPRIITASDWDFIEKGIKQRRKLLSKKRMKKLYSKNSKSISLITPFGG